MGVPQAHEVLRGNEVTEAMTMQNYFASAFGLLCCEVEIPPRSATEPERTSPPKASDQSQRMNGHKAGASRVVAFHLDSIAPFSL
jgi:hypothetical protein